MYWRKQRNIQNFSNKKKIIKIDKDGNETVETVSYRIKFIDKARFMVSSL